MQARIIEFATDKFFKALGKDKDDTNEFQSNLSSKFGNGSSSESEKHESEIQVEDDESSAMLSKKSGENLESSTDDIDGKNSFSENISPRCFAKS